MTTSTAPLNGTKTSRLKSPSVNGITRKIPVQSKDAESLLWGDEPNLLADSTIDLEPDADATTEELYSHGSRLDVESDNAIRELLAKLKDANTVRPLGQPQANYPHGSEFEPGQQLRTIINILFETLGLTQSQQLANINALGGESLQDLAANELLNLQGSLMARLYPETIHQQRQTRAEQFPKGFELSDLYPYLNESQRVVLVVARSMVRSFSRGKAADRKILRRLCHRYHTVSKSRVQRAVKRLRELGIIATERNADIYLLPTAATFLVQQQQAELESLIESGELGNDSKGQDSDVCDSADMPTRHTSDSRSPNSDTLSSVPPTAGIANELRSQNPDTIAPAISTGRLRNADSRTVTQPASGSGYADHCPDDVLRFRLSSALREQGHELSDVEAAILDVAQTLQKRFKAGTPVRFRHVNRVMRRYHGDLAIECNLRSVAKQLVARGLCKIGHQNFELVQHLEPQEKQCVRQPSGLSMLVATELQDLLLIACDNCTGIGFKNRNVVSRAAVQAVMSSRHNLSKRDFNATVQQLVESGVLQEKPSKGSTALRLTRAAMLVLKGDSRTVGEAVEALAADANAVRACGSQRSGGIDSGYTGLSCHEQMKGISTTDTVDDGESLRDVSRTNTLSTPVRDELLARMASSEERQKVTGPEVSPLAAAILCIARDNATMGSLPAEEIFVHATEAGFTRREVNRALGELHTTEIAMFSYCNNRDKYFLEMMNIEGGPNGVDVLVGLEAARKAFDKMDEATIAELRNTPVHLVDA